MPQRSSSPWQADSAPPRAPLTAPTPTGQTAGGIKDVLVETVQLKRKDAQVNLLTLLRIKHTARLLTASLIGRMPLGMTPIALLLSASHHGLAFGGLLAAVYGLSPALGQPFLGRASDRRGQLLPNLLAAAVCALALSALAVAGTDNVPFALACAAIAGAATPPLEGSLRALWPQILPDRRHIEAAYALDSSTQQIVYVMGPLAAFAVIGWVSPSAALAAAAAMVVLGTLLFACSPPSRAWRPERTLVRGDRLGPLRSSRVRAVLAGTIFFGFCIGALDVAALAASERHGADFLIYALPTTFASAGLLGGLLHHRAALTAPHTRQLPVLAVLFALAWLPLTLDPSPVLATVFVALPGLLFIPLLTAISLVLSDAAPAGTTTEAVGWLNSSARSGLSVGAALTGLAGGTYALIVVASLLCAVIFRAAVGRSPSRPPATTARTALVPEPTRPT